REKALDAAAEAAMRVSAELGVGIEPVVMSASEFWWGSSYFLERVRGEGFLIYPDGGSEVKRSEAVEMAMLAGRFIDAVKLLIRNKLYRSAVDEGYNATELAVKAMLLWDGLDLPSSHGGLVGEFGRAYVLTDKVERELGRKLGRALERRSRARYDARADITETDAKEVLELAEKLLKLAREKLRSR
ncbi:MAG: HEPN domain-containing protein, partial [Candidatus Bathyarchaeia archaeon]